MKRNVPRLTVVLVAALVLAALVTGMAFGSAAVTAQDEPPAIPASYYGDVEIDTGEPIPAGTEVIADVEGEEERYSITMEEDGQYGGPEAFEEKLVVPEPDEGTGAEVTFFIDGPGFEETEVDTDPSDVTWESDDVKRVDLSADGDDIDIIEEVDLTIDDEPDELTLEEGDTEDATVTATYSQIGEVVLESQADVDDADLVDDVDFSSNDTDVATLEDFELEANEEGDATVDATVESDLQSETDDVDVSVVAPTPPTGTGAPAPPPDDPDPDPDVDPDVPEPRVEDDPDQIREIVDVPDDVEPIRTEENDLVFDEELDSSTVTYTAESNTESITFGGEVVGEVRSTDLDREPAETGPAPGQSATVTQIDVPEGLEDSPATVRQRVSFDRIEEIDADAEDLRINRYDAEEGAWQGLETEIIGETDTHVQLEAETPGFSLFAVSAVSEPEAVSDAPAEVDEGEEATFGASNSTDRYGEIESFEWEIDGETFTGETVTTTLEEPGDVDAELVVTNDAGETDDATATVSVLEVDEPIVPDDVGIGVILIFVLLVVVLGVGAYLYTQSNQAGGQSGNE